jgi:deoxyribodipyrimidine photo-lyase
MHSSSDTTINANREMGLLKMEAFLPQAGIGYAEGRNFVPGVVSGLAPYIRHRLITEAEIVGAVLQQHSLQEAEKFIQEICWRTYWKGWLEMRPKVWSEYLQELVILRTRMEEDHDLHDRVQNAESGATGIGCLDSWSTELRETGYLHNHVRMWFASIWVHTLRLPWQLGADFFMRHLLDGDPASNTLSWRWVCGLQTQGKVYVATAENIQRFTKGRHAPHGLLAMEAHPMRESFIAHPPVPLARPDHPMTGEKTVLLVTEEDLHPEGCGIPQSDVAAIIFLDTAEAYPEIATLPTAWKRKALEGTAARLAAEFQRPILRVHHCEESTSMKLRTLLQEYRAGSLSIMTPPVGPTRSLMDPVLSELTKEGITLRRLRRPWDDAFWPHATHGFFKLKERIPSVLKQLSLIS